MVAGGGQDPIFALSGERSLTAALASNESRKIVGASRAAALTTAIWSKMASVKAIFFEVSFSRPCWGSSLID